MDGQNGPSGGRVLGIGKILTSSNPVALDVVMAAMAGTEPRRIPTTRIAGERGLGPVDLSAVEIVGDYEPVAGFRLPGGVRLYRSNLTGTETSKPARLS